jgi:hypothetical protein
MPPRNLRAGQSLIETCLVLGMICLIFMGLLQIADLFAAKEVLNHAAARGVRAKTVGFNWWMVEKSIRVASIPNAGKLTEPAFENVDPQLRQMLDNQKPGDIWTDALRATPSSLQYSLERARIPFYLGAENDARAHHILDYQGWDDIRSDHGTLMPPPEGAEAVTPFVNVRVGQDYRLWVPMHRAFIAADSIDISSENSMECHYDLYLEDMFW